MLFPVINKLRELTDNLTICEHQVSRLKNRISDQFWLKKLGIVAITLAGGGFLLDGWAGFLIGLASWCIFFCLSLNMDIDTQADGFLSRKFRKSGGIQLMKEVAMAREELHLFLAEPKNMAAFMQESIFLKTFLDIQETAEIETAEKEIKHSFVQADYQNMETLFLKHFGYVRINQNKRTHRDEAHTNELFNQLVYGKTTELELEMGADKQMDLKKHF